MCCTQITGNAGPKNRQKSPSAHQCTILLGYIFATKARIDNWKKTVKEQYLTHTSPQYGELGPLADEICWRVWGTPANFNGFHILAVLVHVPLVVDVSQTLRHWTEGAIYIQQGGHQIGHWPTFLVLFYSSLADSQFSFKWPIYLLVPMPILTVIFQVNLSSKSLFAMRPIYKHISDYPRRLAIHWIYIKIDPKKLTLTLMLNPNLTNPNRLTKKNYN